MGRVSRTARALTRNRRWLPEALRALVPFARGTRFADQFPVRDLPDGAQCASGNNPLRAYFETHREGPGIWKWTHYFEIYHRHFQRFVGTDVQMAEVGIYSGGSLGMWRNYFGPRSRVLGIDIEPACAVYQSDGIDVMIGDQSDRKFWADVRAAFPRLDILIDDGGHHPEQQIATLEEILPHLAPGGVYLCEDTHGAPNYFASYAAGLASRLNAHRPRGFIDGVHSVHCYPLVTVIEKSATSRWPLRDERRGTQWQPFRFD
ncbi:MAG: class I SAM-dependent methyltransferase [Xanthobacteraceae bacterium]